MNSNKSSRLLAEVNSLQKLLDLAKKNDDELGIVQIQKRISILTSQINSQDEIPKTSGEVALFFEGDPVESSRGISIPFATRILEYYQNILSKIFANYSYNQLGRRGKIPQFDSSNILITETVKGSFGFILKEKLGQIDLFDTSIKIAMKDAVDLIQGVSHEDVHEFNKVMPKLNRRIILSLKDFFNVLYKNNASMRMESPNFETLELKMNRIELAKQRTENTTITENEDIIEGVLIGILPEHKKFEFQLNDGLIISGNVSDNAVADYKNYLKKNVVILGNLMKAQFLIRNVKSDFKEPKIFYVLSKFIN